MPDLLKIILILAAILLLIRLKVPLSATLLSSAAVLGFLFHLSLPRIGMSFYRGALDAETLKLIASLLLILFFSALMKETGSMARAIRALQEIFRDPRATVAIIPAIIGILPIMGGAMLSAPLVEEASDELKLSPEKRTFLNYWFRHIWEYSLPTYPAIILMSTILGVPVAKICLMNLPLTITAILLGIFLGFKEITAPLFSRPSITFGQVLKDLGSFAGNLLPFLAVLWLTLFFKVHLAYSLALACLGTILFHRPAGTTLRRLARESLSLEIVFLIWGIMIFKEILMTSGAMNSVAEEFTALGLPAPVIIIALPFILGLITAYTNAVVGLSFPILLPFFQANPQDFFYILLAYGSGFCAALLSPMHACLVMTQQYFRADLNKLYHLIIPPVTIVFFVAAGMVLIARWISGG